MLLFISGVFCFCHACKSAKTTEEQISVESDQGPIVSELILELINEADVMPIEGQFVEQNLTYVKRIISNKNYFLFTADISTTDRNAFLKALRNDARILNAQWNHKLEKRNNEK
jgi:hypothetical protein